MQMRKVILVYISSSGCCNTLVTMLNNGDFWLSILFHSRVFHSRVFSAPETASEPLTSSTISSARK